MFPMIQVAGKHRICSSHFLRLQRGHQMQKRDVWKFKHVYMPERTPDGLAQRHPAENPDFTKYTFHFDQNYAKPAPPVKVILLQEIEDVGQKFDCVEISSAKDARRAILLKQASYASPFDLEYYSRKKEEMPDHEQIKKLPLARELTKMGKLLASQVIPLLVSMHNEWTLNRQILAASMEQSGIMVPTDCVHLAAGEPINGPNLNLDGMLIRFYTVIDSKMIVPMLGRLAHISADESQNLYSEDRDLTKLTSQQLAEFGLRPETLFYTEEGLEQTLDVGTFMAKRPISAVTGVN